MEAAFLDKHLLFFIVAMMASGREGLRKVSKGIRRSKVGKGKSQAKGNG